MSKSMHSIGSNLLPKVEKWMHALTLLLVAGAGCLWVRLDPDLARDHATALSTAASFVTFYALLVAIVEIRRSRSATETAADAASDVYRAIANINAAKVATECELFVLAALEVLDQGRAVPFASIGRIVKLYSLVFHAELEDYSSIHRSSRSTLESYMYNPRSSKGIDSRATKSTLIRISGQLGQLQGVTNNFAESKR